jgi:D-xylose reductase
MVPALELHNGGRLPVAGLGLWKIDRSAAPNVVRAAIRAGYRHIDCASDYGNEMEAGQGLRRALSERICRRDELWVTSKLWNTYHRPEHVRPACERTLRDLQLDYLDLYMVHFPISLEYVPIERRYPAGWFFDPDAASPRMHPDAVPMAETWGGMEELVQRGVVRNIGVCNFNCALLRDLLSYAAIRPGVLQVELHPFLTQQNLVRFCREEKIAVTAFSPLGASSYVSLGMAGTDESVLDSPPVKNAAGRLGKSAAQVLLRWAIQRGTAVVTKTSRAERLVENISIFDFELSPIEMHGISALNRNRRFNDPGVFCERAFNTFFPIFD